MGQVEILRVIDEEVIRAAQFAARRRAERFIIGWWNDGAQRRFMLLPEGHHITGEPPFRALMAVEPSGITEPLAA
jgi:hypothetical protein